MIVSIKERPGAPLSEPLRLASFALDADSSWAVHAHGHWTADCRRRSRPCRRHLTTRALRPHGAACDTWAIFCSSRSRRLSSYSRRWIQTSKRHWSSDVAKGGPSWSCSQDSHGLSVIA